MSDYDNTNSGALFKNKDKTEQTPTFADYNGSINVDGKEYWINAWLKTSKKGQKFMSLSVSEKHQSKGQSPYSAQSAPVQSSVAQSQHKPSQPMNDDFDTDSIPF